MYYEQLLKSQAKLRATVGELKEAEEDRNPREKSECPPHCRTRMGEGRAT